MHRSRFDLRLSIADRLGLRDANRLRLRIANRLSQHLEQLSSGLCRLFAHRTILPDGGRR